mgnify:CR=1 FL=1
MIRRIFGNTKRFCRTKFDFPNPNSNTSHQSSNHKQNNHISINNNQQNIHRDFSRAKISEPFVYCNKTDQGHIEKELEHIFKSENYSDLFYQMTTKVEVGNEIEFEKRFTRFALANPKYRIKAIECLRDHLSGRLQNGDTVRLFALYKRDENSYVFSSLFEGLKYTMTRPHFSKEDLDNITNCLLDNVILLLSHDSMSYSNSIIFREHLEEKIYSQPLSEVTIPIFLFLLEFCASSLKRDSMNFIKNNFFNLIKIHYDSLSFDKKFWLFKVYFKHFKPSASEISFFLKKFRYESIEDITIACGFWTYFMINASSEEISQFGQHLTKFRKFSRTFSFDEQIAEEGIDATMFLVSLHREIQFGKLSKNQRFQVKTASRIVESFIFNICDQITNHLKKKSKFDSNYKLEQIMTIMLSASYIYHNYNMKAPQVFYQVLQTTAISNIKHLNNEMLSKLSDLILTSNNKQDKDLFVNEVLERVKKSLSSFWKMNQLQHILKFNKMFSSDTPGVSNKEILDYLESISHLFDKWVNHAAICQLLDTMLVEERYDTKLIPIFTRNYRNGLIKPNAFTSRLYLQCKVLVNGPHTPEPFEKLVNQVASFGNTVKNTNRSFLQMQIEDALTRNGITYEFERMLAGFSVDIFIKPNIVIEILGLFHIQNGVFDKFLTRKIKVLEALEFIVVTIDQNQEKKKKNRIEFVNSIKKLIESRRIDGN